MKNTTDAPATMARIAELLRGGNRQDWATAIDRCREQLLRHDPDAPSNIMRMFGGMGSISDSVLYHDGLPAIAENNELHALLSELHAYCVSARSI